MPDAQQQNDVTRMVLAAPAKRWFLYRTRLGMETGAILEDTVGLLVVAANEKHMRDGNREDVARFVELSINELNDFLGIDDEGNFVDSDPADKSASGDPDGGTAGVVAGESPLLSGNGSPAS